MYPIRVHPCQCLLIHWLILWQSVGNWHIIRKKEINIPKLNSLACLVKLKHLINKNTLREVRGKTTGCVSYDPWNTCHGHQVPGCLPVHHTLLILTAWLAWHPQQPQLPMKRECPHLSGQAHPEMEPIRGYLGNPSCWWVWLMDVWTSTLWLK